MGWGLQVLWVGDPQPMALEATQWLGLGWDVSDAEDGSLLPCGFGANGWDQVRVGFGLGSLRCCGWGTLSPWLWLALGWDAGDAEDGSLLPCSFGADLEAGIRLGWDLGWGL